MEHIVKSERELEIIYEPEKVQHLIQKYLANQRMFLKGFDPPYAVKVAGASELNVLSVDMGEYEPEKDQELVLFRILGRYMHLKCAVVGHTGQSSLYTLAVKSAAIARKDREALRIPIHNDEAYITNIRTSKHTIDATLFNIPTSVKVGFSTFEQQLRASQIADTIKIDVYGKRGTVLDEIRKSGKALLLTNAEDPAAYAPPPVPADGTNSADSGDSVNPGGSGDAQKIEFLDYAAYLDDELQETITRYRREKIKSEIIVPINYIAHDMTSIPLGYIQLQNKSGHFDAAKVAEVQEMAATMVERIRDSNTVVVQEHQEILNLSRGGLRITITHEELKDYLARQQGFTFDLIFKMQAPITLHALIRASYFMPSGDLILGLQISGRASRHDQVKRFEVNINNYETKIRAEIEKRKALQK
ncbi:MAG: DUF1577 domain-containing protein [bacterium]|nr:DUF1577 domain-containing protein [bacterium]